VLACGPPVRSGDERMAHAPGDDGSHALPIGVPLPKLILSPALVALAPSRSGTPDQPKRQAPSGFHRAGRLNTRTSASSVKPRAEEECCAACQSPVGCVRAISSGASQPTGRPHQSCPSAMQMACHLIVRTIPAWPALVRDLSEACDRSISSGGRVLPDRQTR
jgi:hypothetical protein